MTITYSIAPNPHWVIIDNFSKLPDGAAIYTYSSLNPSQFKAAFQDSSGMTPYGQPITGFANGTIPPIFWAFDSANPSDTYYIRVYDSDDPNTQNFLWDFDGISGSSGGGGGGTVINNFNLDNLVINNIFYRNIGNQAGTPSLPTSVTIAPSNNAGYVNDATNGNVITNGPVGPDVIFAKNNTTGTDQLNFTLFSPLGINALTGDITPQLYVNYQCTGAGAGETYKYIQFPLEQSIQTLSQQTTSVKIWARCNSGNNTLTLKYRMFFGSGGAPTADRFVTINTINLTNAWASYVISGIVTPSAVGGTVGTCKNDALFLQIYFPFNVTTNIDIIKPSVYLGSFTPGVDFISNDQVDSIVNSPRTGDVRFAANSFLPGWVIMNDGTIARAATTPPVSLSFARNNVDTFPLFDLLWNLPIGVIPSYDQNGNAVARGVSSVADFVANHQLGLMKAAGYVLAGVSGSHLIASSTGAETHTLVKSELPDPLTTTANTSNVFSGGITVIQSSVGYGVGTISNQGGNQPFSILQPTTYMNLFIKL